MGARTQVRIRETLGTRIRHCPQHLAWFEFAPEHAAAFDELVAMLRSRDEWRWVEREVEILLARD